MQAQDRSPTFAFREVYVGYDRSEDIAFKVCRTSLQDDRFILVWPLVQDLLRANDTYARPPDDKASTDFSLTRFLTPHEGHRLTKPQWVLFCDCDFLFTRPIKELFALADPQYAVMVVKHLYTPQEEHKMQGQRQYAYPRKNWSSLMLFNCAHPSNEKLTPKMVNTASPLQLHRLGWLQDHEIGSLPREWNFLVGVYPKPETTPAGIHFTLGIPTLPDYETCDYADLWFAMKRKYEDQL